MSAYPISNPHPVMTHAKPCLVQYNCYLGGLSESQAYALLRPLCRISDFVGQALWLVVDTSPSNAISAHLQAKYF